MATFIFISNVSTIKSSSLSLTKLIDGGDSRFSSASAIAINSKKIIASNSNITKVISLRS